MLVQLTDIKGRPVWINPIHVRAVRDKARYVEVIVPNNTQIGNGLVKARGPVEDVVRAINDAMPEVMPALAPEDDSSASGFSPGAGMGAF